MRNAIIGSVCTLAVVAIVLGISWPTQQAEGQVAISPVLRLEEALIEGLGSGDILTGPGRVDPAGQTSGQIFLKGNGGTAGNYMLTVVNIGSTVVQIDLSGTQLFLVNPGDSSSIVVAVPAGQTLGWSVSPPAGGNRTHFLWALRRT